MTQTGSVLPRHGVDRRYLGVCLVGAVVSAAATWAVVVGRVPLDAVPAAPLVAGACAILALEWLLAAVIVAIALGRADAAPEPAAEPAAPAALESAAREPAAPAALEPAAPAAPEPPPVPAPVALPASMPAEVLPPRPKPPAVVLPPRPGPPAVVEVTVASAEPEIAVLQDRIGQLTAALTLTAAAEDLHHVGVIVQQALTADLRLAEQS